MILGKIYQMVIPTLQPATMSFPDKTSVGIWRGHLPNGNTFITRIGPIKEAQEQYESVYITVYRVEKAKEN